MAKFKPGQSGNPAGRPKGSRNKTTLAALALLEEEARALTRKAVELALEGDLVALKLCLERLIPPRKDWPVDLELPQKVTPKMLLSAILQAVLSGEITVAEAQDLISLMEKAKEVSRLYWDNCL